MRTAQIEMPMTTVRLTEELVRDSVLPTGLIINRRLGLMTKSVTAAPPKPEATDQKQIGVPFEIKADSIDEDARTFSGLASTWDLDLGGDVIRRGAFKRTLKHWKGSKQPMPLLDSHNAWTTIRAVIGKMIDAVETEAGLEATFEVIGGPDGDEVWRRIKGGYVTGLSIGYRPRKVEMPSEDDQRAGVWRYLTEVELREVSVVLYPMNPGAQIDASSMKAMSAAIAALEEAAASRELTAEEKAELTELHMKIEALLVSDEDEDSPKAKTTEPPPAAPADEAKADLAPDDPERMEFERKLNEARLRRLGTRMREISRT